MRRADRINQRRRPHQEQLPPGPIRAGQTPPRPPRLPVRLPMRQPRASGSRARSSRFWLRTVMSLFARSATTCKRPRCCSDTNASTRRSRSDTAAMDEHRSSRRARRTAASAGRPAVGGTQRPIVRGPVGSGLALPVAKEQWSRCLLGARVPGSEQTVADGRVRRSRCAKPPASTPTPRCWIRPAGAVINAATGQCFSRKESPARMTSARSQRRPNVISRRRVLTGKRASGPGSHPRSPRPLPRECDRAASRYGVTAMPRQRSRRRRGAHDRFRQQVTSLSGECYGDWSAPPRIRRCRRRTTARRREQSRACR